MNPWVQAAGDLLDRFGLAAGALVAGLLGLQRARVAFSADRKQAVHTEVATDVVLLLRDELKRVSDRNEQLETLVAEQRDEIAALRIRVSQLLVACGLPDPEDGVKNGGNPG